MYILPSLYTIKLPSSYIQFRQIKSNQIFEKQNSITFLFKLPQIRLKSKHRSYICINTSIQFIAAFGFQHRIRDVNIGFYCKPKAKKKMLLSANTSFWAEFFPVQGRAFWKVDADYGYHSGCTHCLPTVKNITFLRLFCNAKI